MSAFQPTGEQEKIRDAYLTGRPLAVTAGAGTGKTSTLVLLGEAKPARVRYIAFNKSIALEAERRFPKWVRPSTAHSLAWQAVRDRFRDRMDNQRHMPAKEVARILKINDPLKLSERTLAPHQVARLAMETVKHFCYSAAPEPNGLHVPHLKGVDSAGDKAVMRDALVPLARRAWADLIQQAGQLRYQHDYYLKYWQLTGARIDADVLFVDECQDCQPPGTVVLTTNGTVKIEDLRAGDRVISYIRSGQKLRKRGAVITSISSKWHDGELVKVSTETGLESRYTPEHICIAKMGPAFTGKTVLYLMRHGSSWRVGVTSAYHGRRQHVTGLTGRLYEEGGDAIWALAAFDDKRDALMAEATASAKYGLPQMRFRDNGHRNIGQDRLDSFWAEMGDLTDSAARCAAAFGRDIRHPLISRSAGERINGHGRGHLLYTRGANVRACNLMNGMEVLDARPMKRPNYTTADGRTWTTIAVSHEPYAGDVWSMDVEGDHTYVGDDIVTHNCNPVLEAIIAAQDAQVIAVGDACQQLYSWRGAVDALDRLGGGNRLPLSQSFRFGPAVANEANKWLTLLRADLRLSGTPSIPSRLGEAASPRAILARSNAGVMKQVIAQVSAGRKVGMPSPRPGVPGGAEIEKLAKAAISLKQGRGTDHPELMAFQTWAELQDYSQNDPGGEDLSVLVSLIDEHTPEKILSLTAQLVEERYAEVTVSTVHKAKGREWESVAVTDFRKPKKDPGEDRAPLPARDQMMAAYVAVTRAKVLLDRGPLSFVDDYLTAGALA